ncbi:MAG: membrane-bound lytic murein transglycosylase MltF [Shewanella sp.]|uniref:Membrane-bound lytic murein transglycosylase F n=1 Tax=Shewanella cutis TaxID=2766780 RepID=A0ABS9QST9_9GAMM|nr:membrane-bound lytic murein transglycosylase MltF [Shewanella sp. PS-2]MCG9962663.1 membrane-bound lytic murein transglycosylase MltF [Shewanella sp. PS-2]
MTRFLFAIILGFLLTACQQETVEETEFVPHKLTELRVGTLYGPQIYMTSGQGNSGFDYDMAVLFAEYLDVPLKMVPYTNLAELYDALKKNEIDLIAAGMTETPARREHFRLGPPLYRVNQVLVYREGMPVPKNISDLKGKITVIADSSFVETLTQLQKRHPTLVWDQVTDKDNEELLTMIANKEIDYTIADSSSVQINRRYLPVLRSGLVLEEKLNVVWLLPPTHSDGLMSQLLAFWHQEKLAGTLDHLNEKYFGHVKRFDYIDTRAFLRAIETVLPRYRQHFETHAGDLDWRKLAATSYQESHWNPNARSPTGVRGMMMLTQPTAKEIGITNRLDAEESIRGGAAYLRDMINRLPESIPESQRMWFALASYNIGYAHVEDARKLAESMELNPNAWQDLKKVLPLLQKRKYYQKTRYGYARGSEAVHYVDSIRRYYDTLVWVDNQSKQQNSEEVAPSDLTAEETPVPAPGTLSPDKPK